MKLPKALIVIMIGCLLLQSTTSSADVCPMNNESLPTSIQDSMDGHEGHQMTHDMSVHAHQEQHQDCCSETCECLMMSCQSALTINNTALSSYVSKSQLVLFPPHALLVGISTTIYRPPIYI